MSRTQIDRVILCTNFDADHLAMELLYFQFICVFSSRQQGLDVNEWMDVVTSSGCAVPWPRSEETISILFSRNTNPRV